MKIEIRNRWTGAIMFTEEADSLKAASQRLVVRGSDLSGSNLRDSDLSGSDLSGSNLRDSNLSGSNLRDSNLSGSDLSGSDLSDSGAATREEATANLDRVREIILDDPKRLRMDHWHDDESKWQEHTCAEEATCGTTHCLAGWLQVCSTDEKIRKLDTQLAGILCAPIASHMFFRGEAEVMDWLKERRYAKEGA
jgi:hypothetical protein